MAEPFLAEIRLMSFSFAPKGWALCNGQLMPINQNQALFSLLGTTYGGDGRVNFALPNYQGRLPVHADGSHPQGLSAGSETVTLTVNELPEHTHSQPARSGTPTTRSPEKAGPAAGGAYGQPDGTTMQIDTTPVGGSQPHSNLQPTLAASFSIALQGIFPSRT